MDYQRIVILIGLAVTSWLLINAWNTDYNQGPKNAAPDQESYTAAPQSALPDTTQGNVNNAEVPAESEFNIVPTIKAPVASVSPISTPPQQTTDHIISVSTDVFEIKINKLGGDIVSGALPKFPAALDTPEIPFLLLDPRNSYIAQSGLIGQADTVIADGRRPLFVSRQDHYSMDWTTEEELVVDLTLDEPNGVQITKRFTFKRNDYLINVEYIIVNQSGQTWQASMFSQIQRDSEIPSSTDTSGMGMQPFVGGATYKPDEHYTKLDFDDIEEDSYGEDVKGGYMAMVQHYFVSAWIPAEPAEGQEQQTYTYQARKVPGRDIYLFGLIGPPLTIPVGQEDTVSAQFYMGPKDQYRLEEISEGLNLTVDYGFLWWLAQPLFNLLTFIHTYVNNWGLAIIFLTITVKSLLYPLSAASFRSMAKMRKLQPEMVRIKERYGDDRQKQSQAMMDLYKKEGANPLGGCLPMLLQMPVFLALYWALMESVELRQAPFFFWIHDLSAMDPIFVLPVLMGISMYVTQMLQPEPPDPVQAKVFKMMPIMFTFFFLWFPSGLVLYWLINNLLSILQQWYVTRQIEKSSKTASS